MQNKNPRKIKYLHAALSIKKKLSNLYKKVCLEINVLGCHLICFVSKFFSYRWTHGGPECFFKNLYSSVHGCFLPIWNVRRSRVLPVVLINLRGDKHNRNDKKNNVKLRSSGNNKLTKRWIRWIIKITGCTTDIRVSWVIVDIKIEARPYLPHHTVFSQ